jgi:hypothetical protein
MLVSLLSDTLEQTFCQGPVVQAVNDGKTHQSTFMFQCKTVPSMTVKQYFQRLAKYTGVSGESMVRVLLPPSTIQHHDVCVCGADSFDGAHRSHLPSSAQFPGQYSHDSSPAAHKVMTPSLLTHMPHVVLTALCLVHGFVCGVACWWVPSSLMTRFLITHVMHASEAVGSSHLCFWLFALIRVCVWRSAVTGKELNMLEVEFLFLIDFNLFVSTEEYARIYKGLALVPQSLAFEPSLMIWAAIELVTSNPLLMRLFALSPPTKSSSLSAVYVRLFFLFFPFRADWLLPVLWCVAAVWLSKRVTANQPLRPLPLRALALRLSSTNSRSQDPHSPPQALALPPPPRPPPLPLPLRAPALPPERLVPRLRCPLRPRRLPRAVP